MALGTVAMGKLRISRMILGGNPFSGFSHQTPAKDAEMRRFYTTAQIKETLRHAERAGINTHLARGDRHVSRYLLEYWAEGGKIQWVAQTCSELASLEGSINSAIEAGAASVYLHGGKMDFLYANKQLDKVAPALELIRKAGLPVGLASHRPEVLEWANKNVDVDYYMCSYYDPSSRADNAMHVPETHEEFLPRDRQRMAELIQTLKRPAIHYKVMAGGRNDPVEAFDFVARFLRPQDAVCVGFNLKDRPNEIEEDCRLLEEALRKAGKG